MKKALSYLLVYVGIQLCVGAIVPPLWMHITGSSDRTVAMLISTTAVASAITIAVFLLARWAEVSPRWLRSRQWGVLLWSGLAALGALIPSAWIQEQMPELPNLMEQEFEMIIANRWGYVCIGLLAPIAEEIAFRGAILRSLLGRFSTWTAICLSAFLFALVHMNPAQMPHAFIIGILLGWMYYRTGSILPSMTFHWVNNSVAYIIYNLFPNPDLKLIDLFKGSELHVLMAVGFSLLILLPAVYQLHLWMKRAE